MAADILQKVVVIVVLAIWCRVSPRSSFKWSITLFSVATMPNALVVGVPLLSAMYGDEATPFMVEILVLQCIIWNNLLLVAYEYTGAMVLLKEKLPDHACSIASIGDVLSSNENEPIRAEAEVGEDNKLHVVLKKSVTTPSYFGVASRLYPEPYPTIPLASADTRSLKSSTYPTRRSSSLNNIDLYSSLNGRSANTVDQRQTNGGMGVDEESSIAEIHQKTRVRENSKPSSMPPPTIVLAKRILIMVWRKLSKNPTIHASLVGLVWSLVAYRWGFKMPVLVENSITVLSSAGVGMAMFSIGLFMSEQPRFISCGNKLAVSTLSVRFLVGPAVMAAASYAVGLRGKLLQIAIVQAAVPQASITFIFAREYNVHPEIQSTGVIIGMLVSLPVTIVYYILLGL